MQKGTATWRQNLSSWFGMLTASYSVFMIFSFQKIPPLSKQQTVNHWRSQKRNPQPRILPRFLLCFPKWAIHPWPTSQGPVCPASQISPSMLSCTFPVQEDILMRDILLTIPLKAPISHFNAESRVYFYNCTAIKKYMSCKKGVLGRLCILAFQCATGHLHGKKKIRAPESHLCLQPVSHLEV